MIKLYGEGPGSLNPCCNGIYLIILLMICTVVAIRLNPCCNGIYLIISSNRFVRMESCLNPCCNGIYLIMLEMVVANGGKTQS